MACKDSGGILHFEIYSTEEIQNCFENLKIRRIHILPNNNLLVNLTENEKLIVINLIGEQIIQIELSNLEQFTILSNRMDTFIGE